MHQYFLEDTLQSEEEVLYANSVTTHHIRNVLRMKEGSLVKLVDASQQVFFATVHYEQDQVAFHFDSWSDAITTPIVLELQACLIKQDKWDFMLQKVCELGVSKIVPVESRYTVVTLKEKEVERKLERWNKICKSACEQSKRSDLAVVEFPQAIKKIQTAATLKLLAYEDTQASYPSVESILQTEKDHAHIALMIGPEGGFHKEEVKKLQEDGYIAVSLGKRILRAETASIASVDRVIRNIEGDCYEV